MPAKMVFIFCMLLVFRSYAVNKVVYGVDDRVDYDQFLDARIQEIARSTAAMIPKADAVVSR